MSSETVLRQQLVEFTDHRLIVARRLVDGSDAVQLSVDRTMIETFLLGKGFDVSLE